MQMYTNGAVRVVILTLFTGATYTFRGQNMMEAIFVGSSIFERAVGSRG